MPTQTTSLRHLFACLVHPRPLHKPLSLVFAGTELLFNALLALFTGLWIMLASAVPGGVGWLVYALLDLSPWTGFLVGHTIAWVLWCLYLGREALNHRASPPPVTEEPLLEEVTLQLLARLLPYCDPETSVVWSAANRMSQECATARFTALVTLDSTTKLTIDIKVTERQLHIWLHHHNTDLRRVLLKAGIAGWRDPSDPHHTPVDDPSCWAGHCAGIFFARHLRRRMQYSAPPTTLLSIPHTPHPLPPAVPPKLLASQEVLSVALEPEVEVPLLNTIPEALGGMFPYGARATLGLAAEKMFGPIVCVVCVCLCAPYLQRYAEAALLDHSMAGLTLGLTLAYALTLLGAMTLSGELTSFMFQHRKNPLAPHLRSWPQSPRPWLRLSGHTLSIDAQQLDLRRDWRLTMTHKQGYCGQRIVTFKLADPTNATRLRFGVRTMAALDAPYIHRFDTFLPGVVPTELFLRHIWPLLLRHHNGPKLPHMCLATPHARLAALRALLYSDNPSPQQLYATLDTMGPERALAQDYLYASQLKACTTLHTGRNDNH
ncbi:MAG: hypothetical protein AAFX99_22830 [Myxococcota bacterium]